MISFTLATRKQEMVEALCELLRVKSVKGEPQGMMPYGSDLFFALNKMLNFAERMYFDSESMFSRLGYVDYGDGDEMLAILTHLDVVPEGSGWTVPAFGGMVKDGKIYGRGAIDNKGPAIAALFALAAIQDDCISLNKRVRLIFGCDEESGWSDIEFYKKNGGEIPTMAFSPDAQFPIINGEKGLLQLDLFKKADEELPQDGLRLLSISGGDRVNVVPAYCEAVLSAEKDDIKDLVDIFNTDVPVKVELLQREDGLHLITRGLSAHGSLPEDGKNAISYLIAFLNTLPMKQSYLSDAVYQLARYTALQTDGQAMGIAGSDEHGALTLNLGYIKMEEDGLHAGLDIRYPISGDGDAIFDTVKEKMTAYEVEKRFAQRPHFVPEDSVLVQGLKAAYEESTGEKATCMTIGGATYARAFPNAVAFGPVFPGKVGTEHQPDEYIEIDDLVRLADIIANAIVTLCT
ncbi:dipeptidase PepV [Christensenellaceae bacterium OttesenSCG-928-K19]|nr:dipeptidase PepV [Christensenellaceae bacterium OttesenSCG-928-K19]